MENASDKAKKALRAALAVRRRTLSCEYVRDAGERIQARVIASAWYHDARSVFVYVSMPGEPATDGIIRQALTDGKQLYVPKCVGGQMLAVRIRDTAQLRPGAYGILEPEGTGDTAEADTLDLIVVPCVSASSDGRRLGHGAGYYDRFLGRTRDSTVCLCFRRMMCEEIPMTDRDVMMARVVTE